MAMKQVKPKRLTAKFDRDDARRMRNAHWSFMEKIAEFGTVWFCPWDKDRRHRNPAPDVEVDGLIGYGILDWMASHPDWFERGEWNDNRYAAPVRLTPAGVTALENWHTYDMEPVNGGLVEPGWIATPTPLMISKVRRK